MQDRTRNKMKPNKGKRQLKLALKHFDMFFWVKLVQLISCLLLKDLLIFMVKKVIQVNPSRSKIIIIIC